MEQIQDPLQRYSDLLEGPEVAEKTKRRSKLTDRAPEEKELDFVASDAQIYQPDLVELACNGECMEAGFVGREYVMAVDPAVMVVTTTGAQS